jgi:hypothetical protein
MDLMGNSSEIVNKQRMGTRKSHEEKRKTRKIQIRNSKRKNLKQG